MSDQIKAMINALINGENEKAAENLHMHLTAAVKEKVVEGSRRVPAGTFSGSKPWVPSEGRDKDDPQWDWRNPNDNPSGQKPETEKPHKVNGKFNKSNYPILDNEHKTPLFDPDLVSHLRHDYSAKVWDKMSELEQIKAQVDYVSDIRAPMFGDRDVGKFDDYVTKRAKELQKQIKR